jgi:hypothetical protein
MKIIVRFVLLVIVCSVLFAQYTIYPENSKIQNIGMLWNTVTNHGEFGDDRYLNPGPSCSWPRSSGNSYLYAGSILLSGSFEKNGNLEISVLNERDGEYAPIDSVHIIMPGWRADRETYTKYWDVDQPRSTTGDDPLGVTVTERTYAWKNALADDFIITEYTIINVGIDESGNGQPDTQRDIYDFTFSVRIDGDISRLSNWSPEDPRVNQDDHAYFNADQSFSINDAADPLFNGTYTGWEWIKLDPFMHRQLEAEPWLLDSLNNFPMDSMMTFMWDGDNQNYSAAHWGLDTTLIPADYDLEHLDDDSFNPGIDGCLNSPGFLGWRMLISKPLLAPKSYITCTIHDEPMTDNQKWNDYINSGQFCDFTESIIQGYQQWKNGVLNPDDYRTLTSYGSLDTLKSGDTVVVTIAYGVGSHNTKGGIYSLLELNKIMSMAQYIVDNDYNVDFSTMSEPIFINLSAHDELYEKNLAFGWSSDATDEFDNHLDILASSIPSAEDFDIRFINNGQGYLFDARYPSNGNPLIWDLSFWPSSGNAPVNIEWDPVDLPEIGSFFFVDTNGSVVADMRTQSRYTSNATDTTYLKIIYDPNEVSTSNKHLPQEFFLSQNFPNPLNPTTTISYNLPEPLNIKLQIFDITGRLVETLYSGYKEAGTWDVKWNASSFPSGIYFYRLKAGDFVETKKMVLMK